MAIPLKTKRVVFTDAEKNAICDAAHAVWEDCAYDLLQSIAEEKMKDISAVTVSRSLVVEIALDANRTEDRLRDAKRWSPVVTDDLIQRVSDAPYKQLIAIVRTAFPYARYGT